MNRRTKLVQLCVEIIVFSCFPPRTVSHLSQYESAGAEDLKEVSAAYVKLRKEIEGKKWALKELEESAGAK